jgi:hypothetical protein
MQKFTTFAEAVAARADAHTLAHYVVDTVSAFTDGKDVAFDFLAKGSVAIFWKRSRPWTSGASTSSRLARPPMCSR